MTEQEYVARRMDKALDKAIDLAEEKERERGVVLPPQVVGQMARDIFQARLALAMSDGNPFDVPEDEQWGSY